MRIINNTFTVRISSLLFFVVFSFTIINILVPHKAYANLKDDARDEYNAYIGLIAVLKCYSSSGSPGSLNKKDYNKAIGFPGEINVGRVWMNDVAGKDGNDPHIKCNDTSEMESVAQSVGYNSLEDLHDVIYPRDKNCKDECNKKSGYYDVIKKQAKNKFGVDDKLSNGARYYFWDQLLRNGDWGCGMQRTNDEKRYNEQPDDERIELTNPTRHIWKLTNNGEKVGYKYAVFKNAHIQGGAMGINYDKDGRPEFESKPCKTLVMHIAGSAGAGLVDALVEKFKKSGEKSTGFTSNDDSGGDGDNEESCEERTMLSAGWLVCSGLELLSDGMDTLLSNVDSLLNVDVAKMNKDDDNSLYKSWSYFRAIATFMLVAIGLVMIAGQAIGGGQ